MLRSQTLRTARAFPRPRRPHRPAFARFRHGAVAGSASAADAPPRARHLRPGPALWRRRRGTNAPLPTVRKIFSSANCLRPTIRLALGLQPFDDLGEQGHGPFAVEGLVGTRLGGGGDLELRVGGLPVKGQWRHAAAAFLAPGFVPFVGQKMFQRCEQEGAKPSALGAQAFEIILAEEAREERLGEVLGVFLWCGRGGGRRRRAGTSRCGTVPPARGRIAAWSVCPPRARPSNASWRRCRRARPWKAWKLRRSSSSRQDGLAHGHEFFRVIR